MNQFLTKAAAWILLCFLGSTPSAFAVVDTLAIVDQQTRFDQAVYELAHARQDLFGNKDTENYQILKPYVRKQKNTPDEPVRFIDLVNQAQELRQLILNKNKKLESLAEEIEKTRALLKDQKKDENIKWYNRNKKSEVLRSQEDLLKGLKEEETQSETDLKTLLAERSEQEKALAYYQKQTADRKITESYQLISALQNKDHERVTAALGGAQPCKSKSSNLFSRAWRRFKRWREGPDLIERRGIDGKTPLAVAITHYKALKITDIAPEFGSPSLDPRSAPDHPDREAYFKSRDKAYDNLRAGKKKELEMIKKLLQGGALIDLPAWFAAVETGDENLVGMLSDANYNTKNTALSEARDEKGNTAFIRAVRNGNIGAARAVSQLRSGNFQKDKEGKTALDLIGEKINREPGPNTEDFRQLALRLIQDGMKNVAYSFPKKSDPKNKKVAELQYFDEISQPIAQSRKAILAILGNGPRNAYKEGKDTQGRYRKTDYTNDFSPENLRQIARFAIKNNDVELRNKLLPYRQWLTGRFDWSYGYDGEFRGEPLDKQLDKMEKSNRLIEKDKGTVYPAPAPIFESDK